MLSNRELLLTVSTVALSLAGPGFVRAQHLDVLTLQVGGKLVTGGSSCANSNCTSGQWTLGQRVFSNEFPANSAVDKPGFNALANGVTGMPAGAQALPGGTALAWDFLPATIDDVGRNLFYWSGADTDGVPGITPGDVAFGPPPGANYLLSLFDQANAKYSVNGANAFVAGGSLGNTSADGSFHKHRFFQLENSGSTPVDGIYLLAIQLRMSGLANSLPIMLLFGTANSSVAALDDAAIPWVEEQLELVGDYSGNGVVDAADYTVWRNSLSQAGAGLAADGSGNELVDSDDYDLWRQHFGEVAELRFVGTAGNGSASDAAATGVPEPTSALVLLPAVYALVTGSARQLRRGLESARPPR